jgi:hypothetical protein|tara:strand:+ start:41 stop:241 length:201 start_codon:yes stop_codon:yes gene_type:complete
MIEDYDKKDMKAPKVKVAPKVKKEFTLPEGWSMAEKRGRWCVRNPEGVLYKFSSKDEAKKYIEEMS